MSEENIGGKTGLKDEEVANNGSLETLAAVARLDPQLLRMGAEGVLVLPSNQRVQQASLGVNAFAETSKDVLGALREAGLPATLYDDGRERRELALKYADVILPPLLFLGGAALQVGLGILAEWIYHRFVKADAKAVPSVKAEYIEVTESGTIKRWRRIEGPATEVCRLLTEESRRLGAGNPGSRKEELGLKERQRLAEGAWARRRRREAAAALDAARQLIKQGNDSLRAKKEQEAEHLYRESLAKIREAALWEPEVAAHHTQLHEVGRYLHDQFGCELDFKEGQYQVTCPVALSHTKGGFSIGGAAKVICSICGENILQCPHEKWNKYDGVTGRRLEGICNICAEKECTHKEGDIYNGVEAFGIVTDIDLDHVAYVEEPANPLCVVHAYSLPKSELLEMLPEKQRRQFVYGETVVQCHHCLLCNGL